MFVVNGVFFFSSRRRHTRCALVTGVQTCALPIYHPQTIAAHRLNDAPLPIANGAPVRMRIERKLGYKHAKYVHAIEVVDSSAGIDGGRGGFWQDRKSGGAGKSVAVRVDLGSRRIIKKQTKLKSNTITLQKK